MKKKTISLLMAAVLGVSSLTIPALASEDVIIEEPVVSEEIGTIETETAGTEESEKAETEAAALEIETAETIETGIEYVASETESETDVPEDAEAETDISADSVIADAEVPDQELELSVDNIAIVSVEEVEEAEAEDGIAVVSADSSTVLYSGTCGDNLTWQLDNTGVLTISGSGVMDGYSLSALDSIPWYSYLASIKSLVVKSGVTSIGRLAFYKCENLTSVSLPATLTSIDVAAFEYCSALTKITIPEGVTEIAENAFDHCSSLASVSLPSTLATIGSYAFDDCTSLTSITIPASVTMIGGDIFPECRNLQEILVESGNQYYCSVNGVLYTKDMMVLMRYPSAKTGTSYTIPSTVATIEDDAFQYCANLTSISIPDSVEAIGSKAFYNCTGLTQLTLSANLNYTGLYAFAGCVGLTSISFPENLPYINSGVVMNCTGLTSVYIPESVTLIYEAAFDNCSALTDVYYAGSSDDWSKIAIRSMNDELTSAAIHYGREDEQEAKLLSDSACTITLSATSYTYDGNAKKPTVKIVYGSNSLTQGTDYLVFYADYTDAGTATVTIRGKGDYKGTVTKSYTINEAAQTVTAKTSASSITVGKTATISANGQGTITYSSSNTAIATVSSDGVVTAKKPGTVTITVKARGDANYKSASTTVTIKVTLAAGEISSLTNTSSGVKVKWSKVTGASGYYIYRKTGSGSYKKVKTITKASTTSWTDTSIKSKNGTKYTYKVVPYSGSTKGSGTAKTTVRLSGVTLSSAKSASSKKLTVKWKKNSKASGYQIQYSTSSTFAKGNETVKVSGSSKISKTISKLTKNKTYYVRVRAYKTVSGKTYYSAWSSVKKAKVK